MGFGLVIGFVGLFGTTRDDGFQQRTFIFFGVPELSECLSYSNSHPIPLFIVFSRRRSLVCHITLMLQRFVKIDQFVSACCQAKNLRFPLGRYRAYQSILAAS